jgi:hypothetical protein
VVFGHVLAGCGVVRDVEDVDTTAQDLVGVRVVVIVGVLQRACPWFWSGRVGGADR